MAQVNVPQLFAEAALEVNGKTLGTLDRNTIIAKLGLDSVAVMELVGYVEEKLDIQLPDEELAKVTTLGDLGGLVQRLVPAGTEIIF